MYGILISHNSFIKLAIETGKYRKNVIFFVEFRMHILINTITTKIFLEQKPFNSIMTNVNQFFVLFRYEAWIQRQIILTTYEYDSIHVAFALEKVSNIFLQSFFNHWKPVRQMETKLFSIVLSHNKFFGGTFFQAHKPEVVEVDRERDFNFIFPSIWIIINIINEYV